MSRPILVISPFQISNFCTLFLFLLSPPLISFLHFQYALLFFLLLCSLFVHLFLSTFTSMLNHLPKDLQIHKIDEIIHQQQHREKPMHVK
ncbi:hypothetical protein Lalb_Chr25g0290141 [Lupinus albus]|uniref:Uncharacterized protein n=1 Tax=Lupinus albus TaxID=3870 RepID=A0A6A4N9U2_LUPAL|nr:hypothetical protein Lalb_Chr25g0290141 [Lupinus albus]